MNPWVVALIVVLAVWSLIRTWRGDPDETPEFEEVDDIPLPEGEGNPFEGRPSVSSPFKNPTKSTIPLGGNMLDGLQAFSELRDYVLVEIDKHMRKGDRLGNEGAMSLHFPDIDEVNTPEARYFVSLDSAILGHGRRHQWSGKTLLEAVQRARTAIEGWCDG